MNLLKRIFVLGYNTGSIGIAYIGTFNRVLPSEKQLAAGFKLMSEGVKLNKLVPDYKIYAHRQLIASESPGAAFFELIKKWDHWTKEVPEVLWGEKFSLPCKDLTFWKNLNHCSKYLGICYVKRNELCDNKDLMRNINEKDFV